MDMIEHLRQNGINPNLPVGFLMIKRQDGVLQVSDARVVTVFANPPESLLSNLQDEGYDPACDIVVSNDPKRETFGIIQMPNGSSLFQMHPSGVVLKSNEVEIRISQSPAFMEDVCGFMQTLLARSR